MIEPVRWVLLGVGTAGRARARAILADPRARLVAVHRGRYAETLGVPVVPSLAEALAVEADAVAVCSPSEAHAEQVAAALAAGRHVAVEYPLALDADTAARLFAVATANKLVLHEAHIELLGGAAEALRTAIRPDDVLDVEVRFQSPGPAVDGWALAARSHARVHRLVDVAGPVAALTAIDAAPGRLDATLQLRSGAIARLAFGQGHPRETRLTLRTPTATWRQVDATLTRDGATVALPDTGPLFARDHHLVTARLLDGAAAPVPEARLLHVLRVVDALGAGRPGPIG